IWHHSPQASSPRLSSATSTRAQRFMRPAQTTDANENDSMLSPREGSTSAPSRASSLNQRKSIMRTSVMKRIAIVPASIPPARLSLAVMLALTGMAGPAHAQEPAITLEPVVVTASGVQQRVKDAPASMTVITREQIEKSGYTTAAEALSHVEGVAMVGGDPNNKDIVIRGLPGEYTLVLVDGRRQNTRETMNRGTGGVQYAFMPPLAAIERIEVVRGPMSSLYGSEAMGGVVNIITKKVPEKWTAALDTSVTLQTDDDYGNSRETQFWIGGPIKDDV